ncbi:MAG: NADH-quinone oxidoreductase subunit NuoG [Armatimonadetes bacterium]|nr:NADH-quinone oxidoreductase subunit NuoG [Armatimonadota bacterium]
MSAEPRASNDQVTITVNDVELSVPKGELIVESVKRLGLEIPVFCYHPRMDPVGMCRMCLVEVGFKQADGSVRMMPKPQAGCTLPASEGMVVLTDSEAVHRDRRGVLEFLLVNHPLDCPVCDRGGECPLQNNTLAYGPSTSRFIELKRHLPKAFPLSRYVTLDLERCIQCGRCVRFTEEVSGEHELAFRFRGAEMQPSTFQLTDFESKFSGNVIEICPVGALTSSKYRFRARPWDLETTPSVCTECSNGCNVWFDHRAGKYVRTNGRVNEAVNEEWTCDRGKFGHGYYNSPSRLTSPLVRKGDGFVPVSWGEAYEEIAKGFDRPGAECAGLTGPRVSNEALYLFRKVVREQFGSPHLDHRWTSAVDGDVSTPSMTIAGLERQASILVFGDLAAELPIVYLRVRKAAVKRGAKVVVLSLSPNECDTFSAASLRFPVGAERDAVKALSGDDAAASRLGWDSGTVSAARSALGQGTAVVASDRALDLPQGLDALRDLRGWAATSGGSFDVWPTGANSQGAEFLDVRPAQGGASTFDALQAAAQGRVKALWLMECDPTTFEGGAGALENAEFVVVQGTQECEAMAYASVVLPMAAPAEQDGTWTNCEGRVQNIGRAVSPPGDAKPAWRIFSELLLRLSPATPFFNPREVLTALAAEFPRFSAVADGVPEEGLVLAEPQVTEVGGA